MLMESFHIHPPLKHWSYNNGGENFMGENLVKTEKWVKHYSSSQKILLVGEGDFSFSLSLALTFGSASNIFATSIDSYETLINTYKKARFHLMQLRLLGATVLHEVDATKMKDHPQLNMVKFDCIVYNFPHAGFFGKEDNPDMIKLHQALVHGFFSNARWLLRHNGEIHVTHKTKPPYSYWNLKELATRNSLLLKDCVPFNIYDYPLYKNKRGHGSTSDEPFDWRDSYTFKFAVTTFPTDIFCTNRSSIPYNMLGCREPLPRVYKFIVKAEVSPHTRAAGCAGALVDETHTIRAKFLGPLPYTNTDVAELLAVKFALLMFERSDFFGFADVAVDIECDSNIVISWIRSQFGNPRELEADLDEIRMALHRIPNHVEFCCRNREYGGKLYHLVHQLAVEAMDYTKFYEAWLPYNIGI